MTTIPMGGGIINDSIIYEPLADGSYVVSLPLEGRRSIVDITPASKDTPASLMINGRSYYFQGKPEPPFWFTPRLEFIMDWINGKVKALKSAEIFDLLKRYFEDFVDFDDASDAIILALFAIQSHIKPVLNTLFQQPISGAFGSGKTNNLSALGEVSYHPLLDVSTSPAARVRILKEVSPTYLSDELDQTTGRGKGDEDDNLALTILRAGYKRGYNYIRWDSDNNTWVSIPIFFPLSYTISSDIEQALKQRSLGEVAVSKSKDSRVPVINTARAPYSQAVAAQLFIWRFEFFEGLIKDGRLAVKINEDMKPAADLLTLSPSEFRARVYDELTASFTLRDKFLLEHLFGREAELCYVAVTIERLLGVDVVRPLAEALNRSLESLSSEPDVRFVEFRRLIVSAAYDNMLASLSQKPKQEGNERMDLVAAAYFDSPAKAVQVDVNGVMADIRNYAQAHKLREPSNRNLGTWYRKLGFVSGRNKFHAMTGDYLLINEKLWYSIQEGMRTARIDLEALPPYDSNDLNDPKTAIPEGTPSEDSVQPTPGKPDLESLESLESSNAQPSEPTQGDTDQGSSPASTERSFKCGRCAFETSDRLEFLSHVEQHGDDNEVKET
jgi:hypothetical protein